MNSAAQDRVRTADGALLLRRLWATPAGAAPRARALVVHGLGEHLGRYEDLGGALAGSGIETRGVDLRGHGLSHVRRGHVRRWQDYHLDLDAAAPPPPFAVIAHSMGCLVALDWTRARAAGTGVGPPPAAVILSGPLLDVAVRVAPWKVALSGILSRLAPGLPIPTGIPLDDLCTDPSAVARFAQDPLRGTFSTPRWYTEMQLARRRVLAALPLLGMPAQFHLAGDERIVSGPAVLTGHAAWGGPKELLRWPSARHEILQESCRDDVMQHMARFLLKNAHAA
jgi:alpha-beta hydrolase superfamily lysophospholipase